ncbi:MULTISPECIES: regulatory protein RecX [Acinetobacter]|uniref:regulatory protein RecX n=1 Tax=Acinetobacter TaxID=469 RepID=UPI00141B5858|nr:MULTISPECIES: regulatory protein RecX [Acinetobacter]MCS4297022.1 regulatory protein [Acinetobacter guillouiae]MCW2251144.1 regulatory protein [Acinetobacter sp. BIGb0204]NII36758.1 regulatory protein [Acinetobacter sp. BIGb0196]
MSQAKFPKLLDYQKLKQQFGEQETTAYQHSTSQPTEPESGIANDEHAFNAENDLAPKPQGLTGTRLRSYAFAVLTRKEYSKADLIEKLMAYAQSREEVLTLVDELSANNYQSDQRVAEMTVRSQVRRGKGPNRIKLALRAKQLDKALVQEDIAEIDWYEQAYQLKVKKYGTEVSKDPKIKAKQIRFLQYRGFEMDAIMKAISKKPSDD